jgi:DNA modification methylase
VETLGKYRLDEIYNEDSYQAIKDIPDKSIDCIYVDVPYLYNQGGFGNSDLGKRQQKKRLELRDNGLENGINFSIFDEFVRIMKRNNIFIWCSKLQLNDIMNYFIPKVANYELMVWCKSNPSPTTNNTWLPDVEYCLYFRDKGVELNDGYELKSKWFVSPINKEDKDLYDHPTIKPLELVKRHLLHVTQPNDIVADFFLGSGTTCVAAKELGRRYLGFENNEDYFQIAKDRLMGINQIERKLIENGQTSLF